MERSDSLSESPRKRNGLLRDQVQLVKRKDTSRYEIVPFPEPLSFEKGFFVMIRAIQLLVQNNEGIIFVGVAGPSGAGKTVFTEKVLNFMPSVAVISMDNYNDASRIVDGNFDDPRLTDYDTLLENIHGLKEGRTVDVPSSRIVIIEGIYALSDKLRPILDLRVSVTGGVHFDLVKRVLRDIQRAGQEPEEIIHQISETVYPMYKAFIEPDLKTAHIRIINKFNPFSGFQNPMYILKSPRSLTPDQIKAALGEDQTESNEETYDIYLLPPGEDPEACQSYLRMRNREGKYNLMFEEWVTDNPFIISPRITFEVSVRLLGGLMALGYTIAAILKRSSRVFSDGKATVKIDWLEQLNRRYIQVQGRDRLYVKFVAEQLGLDGSYIPRTYIEQIQLEKLMNDVMGAINQLSEQISTLNERMDEFTCRVEDLNSKFTLIKSSPSQQNLIPSSDTRNGSAPTNLFVSQLGNGTLIPHSSSSNQLSKESPLMEEITVLSRGQRQVIHQLDNLTNLLHEHLVLTRQGNAMSRNRIQEGIDMAICPLIILTIGSVGYFVFKSLNRS
ncbi:Uridine-cytidine kinase C [Triticum urartu]|uniref:Uridine-cytidine kinase C n=1 Tax=Triticum urartu TaxID=4572 RepID=M7ZVS4_TRIUA|nr:Uridine-cytidine kinase C [Triticum urartu]